MSTDSQLQPTVHVVNADCEARQSLVDFLSSRGYTVRGFPSLSAFDVEYADDTPGCLILDVELSEGSGLTLYEHFVRAGRHLPVIFVSADADISTAVAAMKAGAVEFLERPIDWYALTEHIARAFELDAQWRSQRNQFAELDVRIKSLTRTDQETLQLLRQGLSNKVMATRLGLTERAIELRRRRLMQRLQVGSLAELLDLAITHQVFSELCDLSRTPLIPE